MNRHSFSANNCFCLTSSSRHASAKLVLLIFVWNGDHLSGIVPGFIYHLDLDRKCLWNAAAGQSRHPIFCWLSNIGKVMGHSCLDHGGGLTLVLWEMSLTHKVPYWGPPNDIARLRLICSLGEAFPEEQKNYHKTTNTRSEMQLQTCWHDKSARNSGHTVTYNSRIKRGLWISIYELISYM